MEDGAPSFLADRLLVSCSDLAIPVPTLPAAYYCYLVVVVLRLVYYSVLSLKCMVQDGKLL